MERLIFHVDVNSAFLSWEAAKRVKMGLPDLRDIPSCIGGDPSKRTGIVVAKSIPAKKYGIQTGEPMAMAFRKCPNLVAVPSDFELYDKCSRAFKKICGSYAPVMESFSIDEVFLDMTGTSYIYPDPVATAHELKDKIRTELGFTVNIGISTNKLLAKMASDFEKPDKVHTLFPEEIPVKMWPLPVSSLLMCGRSSQETLRKLGISTIGDLARCDKQLLAAHLKSHGILLWEYANGIDSSVVEPNPAQAKGIGNSTTMPTDALSIEDMKPVLLKLCESVCARLRKAHMYAGTITVEIKYSNFHSCSHQIALPSPDYSSTVIYETSLSLLQELWNGTPVRLLGVRATRLTDETAPIQLDLFSYQEHTGQTEKNRKLDKTIDAIRRKYGEGAIMRGSLLSHTDTHSSN